jgi:sugar phosphate permease
MDERGSFQVRRIFAYTVYCLNEMLVFYERAVPAVLYSDMSESYHVSVSRLGVFSSMFFYPYGVLQPFTGLIADVFDPARLIGVSTILAAIGAMICGLSPGFAGGCVGRVLNGIFCAPIYVPGCRFCANWFPLAWFARLAGGLAAVGSVGQLLGQGPTAVLARAVGWRWCFGIVGIIGIFFGVIILLFTRGHPTAYGYDTVNADAGERNLKGDVPIGERFRILIENLKVVLYSRNFWFCALWSFFVNGPMTSITAFWGGPLLRDVWRYSNITLGKLLMSVSIRTTIGSLIWPAISDFFRVRKWFIFASTFVDIGTIAVLGIFTNQIGQSGLFAALLVAGFCTSDLSQVLFAMVREYYPSAVAATAVGCINTGSFLGGALDQLVTGAILDSFGRIEGKNAYSESAYRWGVFAFTVGNFMVGLVLIAIAKDVEADPDSEEKEQPVASPPAD